MLHSAAPHPSVGTVNARAPQIPLLRVIFLFASLIPVYMRYISVLLTCTATDQGPDEGYYILMLDSCLAIKQIIISCVGVTSDYFIYSVKLVKYSPHSQLKY